MTTSKDKPNMTTIGIITSLRGVTEGSNSPRKTPPESPVANPNKRASHRVPGVAPYNPAQGILVRRRGMSVSGVTPYFFVNPDKVANPTCIVRFGGAIWSTT